MTERSQEPQTPALTRGVIARSILGGALMGLANLVPGISGGTMLVAAGVYTRFIDAVSDATRLRLGRDTLVILATIVGAAVIAIGGLAGLIALGLAEFRWGMYSLFIGLTLGGVPIMLGLVRPMTPAAIAGLVGGLAAMGTLVFLQSTQPAGQAASSGPLSLGLAGVAGASAMILPGVSGAYLLLILGQYETIIHAVKQCVKAASAADIQGVLDQTSTILPVAIGVVVGVAVIGNLLRFVLHRFEKATLGVLLGLLIAAPAGLYPFKEGVPPAAGDTFEGVLLTEQTAAEIDPKDWPERFFTPGPSHIAGSLALIAAGIGMTLGIARLGREKPTKQP